MLTVKISSEKGIFWKQGNHTRYEHTSPDFIFSVHEHKWLIQFCSDPLADLSAETYIRNIREIA